MQKEFTVLYIHPLPFAESLCTLFLWPIKKNHKNHSVEKISIAVLKEWSIYCKKYLGETHGVHLGGGTQLFLT
jgi:coproporphyrinogen III oxidase-like Fe-S oxidoreductase